MRKTLFAALLGLAAPVSAAEPDLSADEQVIVVEGIEAKKKEISNFVRAIIGTNGSDPLARFDTVDLCPVAVGFNKEKDAAIADRMRRVAKAANIPLANPGCRGNAIVIMTRDKDAMIGALRKEYPGLFYDASNRPIKIAKQSGAATAWHLTARIDRDGRLLEYDEENGREILTSSRTPSRLTANLRPVVVAAVVVIELESLVGLTTIQVGDYAAMRAFTLANPDKLSTSKAPTILTILESSLDSEIPITLTEWDLSYLRNLYASEEYQYARQQKTQIAQKMAKDIMNPGNEAQ